MSWFGNRFSERYTYVRVSWEGWDEGEKYEYITDGSLEFTSENSLMVTGNFNYDGLEIPDTNDLLRVYYSFRDDDDELTRVPLATLFISYSGNTYQDTTKGIKSSGTITGSSVLQALDRDYIGAPLSYKAYTNVIYEAQKLVTASGLRVDFEPSPVALKSGITFGSGTSKLDIVNKLCDIAGYNPAWPDVYGVVNLKPAKDQGTIDFTFRNNSNSIMYPEIEHTSNWQDAPNIYRLLYNTDVGCVIAEARNESGSKVSLDVTGNRPNVAFEEVTDIGEGAIATQLRLLAEDKLKKASCDVEYVKMSHAYYPIYLHDIVGVRYSDMGWSGVVTNMSISLSPSTKTQTKIKRELENNIQVKSKSEVLRSIDGLVDEDI